MNALLMNPRKQNATIEPAPVSSTSARRWPVFIQPANHVFCSHHCVFTQRG